MKRRKPLKARKPMKRSRRKRATAEELEYLRDVISRECLCCLMMRQFQASMTEAHHLKDGNRRRGHLYAIPLCAWHHRGEPGRWTKKIMHALYGPNLHDDARAFHAKFGTDEELLERYTAPTRKDG